MINELLLRDPVHDLIAFDRNSPIDRTILSAIDTFEVQRLRRIKQLGMAHLAFQGAEHSRFSHSVGVLHLVRRMLARLSQNNPVDDLMLCATMLAALLHDIGHGPFSHVMEKFFKRDHEAWSKQAILDPGTQVNAVLRAYSSELPERIVELLDGEAEPRWLNSLISSQMDADRFDYLMRDSHMTGVKYGVFDLERLLLLLRVSEDGEKIVIAGKGLMAIEKYLQSRYQMYRQVYFHKTVTAAEAMLMAMLDRARDLTMKGESLGIPEGAPLARVLGDEEIGIADFLSLDDATLQSAMNQWSRGGDPILADLSMRLMTRRLFKSVEIEAEEEKDMLFDAKLNEARDLLEGHGLDWKYYLRFSKSSDTPYKPYTARRGSSTIWVQNALEPSVLHDVKDVSPTIKAYTESQYTIHRVFFPETAGGRDLRAEMSRILRG